MSKVIASAVVALAIVGALVWWFGFRNEPIETAEVRSGSIDVTIQTIGQVQSTGATTIRAQTSGQVEVVAAGVGDFVVEGDILVQLDREPLEDARDVAMRQLEDAEFALQAARHEEEQSPDNAELTLVVLQAAQSVEAAQRTLEERDEAIANASIQAPRDGVILELLVASGDVINDTRPVAVLYTRDDLEVIADVDELDLTNVNPGAIATVRLDAFPAVEIHGSVVATAPMATDQGGATVFPTTIAVDIPDDLDVRPGMNADVTIVTDERENVPLIPQGAVRTVGERAFVDVVENGDRTEREVILGYRSGNQVEVVSGLSIGDRVALP